MQKGLWVGLALIGLAACDTGPLTNDQTPVEVKRFYADYFQWSAFRTGPVFVLAEEHGKLHTYRLRPCRSNTRVCGTTTGTLERSADFEIVRGAYPGRTFYLSAGGDGYMNKHGRNIPLAWDE